MLVGRGAVDESREGAFLWYFLLYARPGGKMVLTFESVGKILKCVHSVECQ